MIFVDRVGAFGRAHIFFATLVGSSIFMELIFMILIRRLAPRLFL
jgi:hypothetical protein